MTVRTGFVVVLALVLGAASVAGWPGPCNNKWQLSRCNPEISIKNLTAKAEAVFVGTVSRVEPADYKIANDKTDELFYAANVVTFAVDSSLKGPETLSIAIKGSDLFGLYNAKQFLIFLHAENKDGFRFSPPNDAFEVFNATSSPDWHWEVGVRGGKRLPAEYEPYVLRFDMNSSLWLAGDTARWPPTLRKDVEKELVAIDPQFADTKKANEVFSLTTRGCHWIKDEWDRPPINGVGYIGWTPCPLPLALVKAYVKVLVKTEGK